MAGPGFGLAELAVVCEELGRGCVPGPFLPTVIAAIAIDRWAVDPSLAAPLVDGTMPAGFALDRGRARVGRCRRRAVPASRRRRAGASWTATRSRSASCRASIRPAASPTVTLPDGWRPAPDRVLASDAEVATRRGGAVRRRVGRARGVVRRHRRRLRGRARAVRPADRPVPGGEAPLRRRDGVPRGGPCRRVGRGPRPSTPLDDGWELAVAAAASRAPDAASQCAKDCIQVLGGIGYTWEHDAHLYLKRATAERRAARSRRTSARAEVARLSADGARRRVAIDLPVEAEPFRDEVRAFVADLAGPSPRRVEPAHRRGRLPGAPLAEALRPRRVRRPSSW